MLIRLIFRIDLYMMLFLMSLMYKKGAGIQGKLTGPFKEGSMLVGTVSP